MENKDRGLASIVAMQASSTDDLIIWSEDIAADVVLLLDNNQSVFNNYKEGGTRPQYIVIDADMNVVLKTPNKRTAEDKILEILD